MLFADLAGLRSSTRIRAANQPGVRQGAKAESGEDQHGRPWPMLGQRPNGAFLAGFVKLKDYQRLPHLCHEV